MDTRVFKTPPARIRTVFGSLNRPRYFYSTRLFLFLSLASLYFKEQDESCVFNKKLERVRGIIDGEDVPRGTEKMTNGSVTTRRKFSGGKKRKKKNHARP